MAQWGEYTKRKEKGKIQNKTIQFSAALLLNNFFSYDESLFLLCERKNERRKQ
jgi:hypothetical protein